MTNSPVRNLIAGGGLIDNKMQFAQAIDQWINQESHSPTNVAILLFLKSHGVGRENAKTWRHISNWLQDNHNIKASKNQFQQGLLRRSRYGSLFIASSDYKPSGYFLIAEPEDARVMIEWYTKRIKVEQAHLDHLKGLCAARVMG